MVSEVLFGKMSMFSSIKNLLRCKFGQSVGEDTLFGLEARLVSAFFASKLVHGDNDMEELKTSLDKLLYYLEFHYKRSGEGELCLNGMFATDFPGFSEGDKTVMSVLFDCFPKMLYLQRKSLQP